jgi:hypothetical protein
MVPEGLVLLTSVAFSTKNQQYEKSTTKNEQDGSFGFRGGCLNAGWQW